MSSYIQDMNEPANFQTDDPQGLIEMNCTGKYNFPPYMPSINCLTRFRGDLHSHKSKRDMQIFLAHCYQNPFKHGSRNLAV